MLNALFVSMVLSGSGTAVAVADGRSASGMLGQVERALGLPPLQWGMALVRFKERARDINTADALTPCRPDGEVCRLTVVREFVEPGTGELPSLRDLFAERGRDAWAARGALRLGPVAELVFDRTTARLTSIKVMHARELASSSDVRLEPATELGTAWRSADAVSAAQFVPGTWSLTPRTAAVADAAFADKEEGTVRFVASPWAEVSCGERVYGQTPFRELTLPAGSYDCELSNPELGASRSVHFQVRPNQRSVVRVRFE